MITSNEPGIYKPGRWGIRIENLVVVEPAQSPDGREMLGFETLTLCPIDTRCLDMTLLHPHEVQWLNDYHATVRERLLSHVTGAARAWLELRTRAV